MITDNIDFKNQVLNFYKGEKDYDGFYNHWFNFATYTFDYVLRYHTPEEFANELWKVKSFKEYFGTYKKFLEYIIQIYNRIV